MAESGDWMGDHTGAVQANLTKIVVDLKEEGDSGRSTCGTSEHGLGSVEGLSSRPGGVPSPAHLKVGKETYTYFMTKGSVTTGNPEDEGQTP